MYTIAFDETTNFESLKNEIRNEEPIMIAGILFNDTSVSIYKKNGKTIDPERERIINYYKAVCKEAKTIYPRDLHRNGSNEDNERKTKEEISKTLGEYIKFGTYHGRELLFVDSENNIVDSEGSPLKREGFYNIITLLKTSGEYQKTDGNILQRDDVASNLYLNMVQEYLKKGIFLNLSIMEDNPRVVFNLPSRKLPKTIVENPENYSRAGYGTHVKLANKKIDGDKDKHSYTITDEGYYRSLISEFCSLRKIDIEEVFTKSIYYGGKQHLKQAYMFLADSVCSFLSFRNSSPYDQDIRKKMNTLNYPKRNMFFYYEGRDDFYDRSAQAFIQNDALSALSEVYNGQHWSAIEVRQYYRKKWYPFLEKKILSSMNSGVLSKTIEALDNYRYTDNLDQKKILYILKVLEEAEKNIEVDKRYKFKLADIGISAYTHTGNPQKAEKYFHECMKYQDYIDSDDLQRIQIRHITTLNDLFAFEKARDYALSLFGIEINQKSIESEKKKRFILRVIDKLLSYRTDQIPNSSETVNERIISLLPEKVSRPNMYKSLSSLGQTYAFLKDSLAEYCFLKSINDIQYSPDSSVTKSYLLHWYIDIRDEEKYRENSLDYYSGYSDLNDQLSYLIKEGSKKREDSPKFSLGYAMYVFIKAFYMFYKDDPENKAVANRLINIKETVISIIPDGDQRMKNHPWEIIFKYSAMLANDMNDDNSLSIRSQNKRSAKDAIGNQPEYIIKKIMEFGDIELLSQELTNDYKIRKYNRKINGLWKELYLKNVFSHRNSTDIRVEEKLDDLNRVFTFMYH